MHSYLLLIQRAFPGCGITVHNVWDTPFIWWEQYVLAVDELLEKR